MTRTTFHPAPALAGPAPGPAATALPGFTRGQWLAALGLALALHGLMAWSLLGGDPSEREPAPVQGGSSTLTALSLGMGDPPLLTDVGSEAALPVAASAMLEPVPPPEARPMTTPARPATAPPKPRPAQAPATASKEKSDQRTAKARATRGSGRDAVARADGGSAQTAGPSTGPAGRGTGIDRPAAPRAGNPKPRYPQVARRQGLEGRVLIRVSVLGDGRVGKAAVASSSGHGALDQAALEAVARWRFQPALDAGKPVATTLTVPVVFRLEG